MPRRARIGRAELEVLRYVADHQPVSVRGVADHMARTAGKARTTILTVMERLRRKGYLGRRKAGGVYQYALKVPKETLLESLVEDFVEQALGGSVSPFVAYLARTGKLGDAELAQLEQLVRELDQSGRHPSGTPTSPTGRKRQREEGREKGRT